MSTGLVEPNWLVVIAMAAGLVAFGRPRRLRGGPAPAAAAGARVVVVIPARDEEHNLPGLLTDLTSDEAGPARVVVVDDDSDDATFECASRFDGVEVVRARPRPTGWGGKPWACEEGVRALGDEDGSTVLVFLDADVRAAGGAIRSLVQARHHLGGVVSVQPRHVVPTWTEQLSALFNVVGVMGIGAGTTRPTGLFGPVICCTLADYRAVGGHAAVREQVAEDLALGRRFRRHGTSVRVFVGGPFTFRMYPAGWPALREGWSKNISTGAACTPAWRAALIGLWVTGLIVAVRDLAEAAMAGSPRAGALGYGVACATVAVLARRVGDFRAAALLAYPVLLVAFLALFARSAWCSFVRRSVTWKGRAVPTGLRSRRLVEPPERPT